MHYQDMDRIRSTGEWDADLGAYRVLNDKNEEEYFVWARPSVFFDAVAMMGLVLFWIIIIGAVVIFFIPWPQGVEGNRKQQLAGVLQDKYRAQALWLPASWGPTQVFDVDLVQSWDNSTYDRPEPRYYHCRLQPGATSADLSLSCPSLSGPPPEGGADSELDQITRRFDQINPGTTYDQAGQSGPSDAASDPSWDPYAGSYEESWDTSYGEQEMYP